MELVNKSSKEIFEKMEIARKEIDLDEFKPEIDDNLKKFKEGSLEEIAKNYVKIEEFKLQYPKSKNIKV